MSYPYYPPNTHTVDGKLYHLSSWYYSNDYTQVVADYFLDDDFEHTTADTIITVKFNTDN